MLVLSFGHNSLGATREPRAVCRSGPAERGFEERLVGDSARVLGATAASQPGDAAAILQHRVGVGLLKLLPAERHHVRHRIEVNRLVLVSDSAPDVAEF